MPGLWIDNPSLLLDTNFNPMVGSIEEKINATTKLLILFGTAKSIINKNSQYLIKLAVCVGIVMLLFACKEDFQGVETFGLDRAFGEFANVNTQDCVKRDPLRNNPMGNAPATQMHRPTCPQDITIPETSKKIESSLTAGIPKDGIDVFFNHTNGSREFYRVPHDQNNFAESLYGEGLKNSHKEGALYAHLGLPFNKHSILPASQGGPSGGSPGTGGGD